MFQNYYTLIKFSKCDPIHQYILVKSIGILFKERILKVTLNKKKFTKVLFPCCLICQDSFICIKSFQLNDQHGLILIFIFHIFGKTYIFCLGVGYVGFYQNVYLYGPSGPTLEIYSKCLQTEL